MNEILLNIVKELFRIRPEKYLILGAIYWENYFEWNSRMSIVKASNINQICIIGFNLEDSINATLETDFSPMVLLLLREISERYSIPKGGSYSRVYYIDREFPSKILNKRIR